jgi:hypothetical protein
MLSAKKQADDILAGYAQGADEYVAKPVELAVLAAKVEQLLKRMNVSDEAAAVGAPRSRGMVCLFLHGKGGVGTTTLAVNGAIALASSMIYRVTLLDLSLEFPNAALLMNVKPQQTLADLSDVRIEDMTDDLFDLFLAAHPSGVRLVVGAERPELAELVTVPAVHHALDRLRAVSDYVIVDHRHPDGPPKARNPQGARADRAQPRHGVRPRGRPDHSVLRPQARRERSVHQAVRRRRGRGQAALHDLAPERRLGGHARPRGADRGRGAGGTLAPAGSV